MIFVLQTFVTQQQGPWKMVSDIFIVRNTKLYHVTHESNRLILPAKRVTA